MLSCYTVLGSQLSVPYAMIARGPIAFGGTNTIDSFNSQNPNFSSNGQYDSAKSRDQALVATTSTAANAITLGNARIKGTVGVGAGGQIVTDTNGAVGDAAWITNGGTGIEQGHSFAGFAAAVPNVSVPFSGQPLVPTSGVSIVSNHFNFYDFVLYDSGTNFYQSASLTGDGYVVGIATLYVTDNLNVKSLYIAPGASLTVYVSSGNANIASQGVTNDTGNALNFCYYGLPGNTNLTYSSSSPFSGVIYAPQANVLFSNSADVTGAIVASSITFSGNGKFHFDENLSRSTCAGIILAPQLAGNNFTFNFPTLSGHSYTLQQSSALNEWQDCSHLVGDGSVMQLTVPMTNLGSFFRLRMP
jgi:hypothetical protein